MGQCGGLDCFSPLAPFPIPISLIPSGLWCLIPLLRGLGVGQSLGPAPGQSMCSLWGWIRAGVTHLESVAPCTCCPGCLPHPKSRIAWDSHSPPLYWDVLWTLVLPMPLGQGSIQALPHVAPGVLEAAPFPPALHPGQPLAVEGRVPGAALSFPGHWGCAQPWIPAVPQLFPRLQSAGKGRLGHGRGGSSRSLVQASCWSCASSTPGWHLLRVHM